MKFRFVFINLFFALFSNGCLEIFTSIPSPLTGLNVYDAYLISQDERGIYAITKDKVIKTKIQSKILASSGLSNLDIDVESFYGNVYLIGIVPDMDHKTKLINLAKDTAEVEKIYTYIRFPSDEKKCENSLNIMLALKNNLFADSKISGTSIRVSVVQCNVVFTGIITDIEQEKHAIWYAKHIEGVNDVYSFLRVIK
ncbi:BON domain-containing protein [Campylobacter sp. CCUG 57310]|uniref:BON domain-containing protein n=1 Tax=Campylobacter sp. CCUG 57310 TaxID=2517362 RepID=UPI001566708B|nr:BON domain-containing protein [Campylobacter sp. CCUG 57310]QKF91518.1 putative periplasmic chaperone OsmY (BON domain) [Campylobacter sp. CCUG 57310]